MAKKVIIYTDGGARGNPGPAGIGAVILDGETKKKLAEISEYIGETTNNQAEYQALYKALLKAKDIGADEVSCFLDSQLVVRQLGREYKVRDAGLAAWFVKVWNLVCGFKKATFTHVEREKNQEADRLVNQAIDRHLTPKTYNL
ncbi:MAG: ribonuclease HI family protein [Parcubacteria group bacterium]|nr:ribonuclease HI family protein [Parcubacteria group bacterium]